MEYTSFEKIESSLAPGVNYKIAKISFGRRVELMRHIRDLAAQQEFLKAGERPDEKMEASVVASEIDRTYLLWGLKEVTGLELDGEPATPMTLSEIGPEDLFREAVAAVKRQCGLSEAERKN